MRITLNGKRAVVQIKRSIEIFDKIFFEYLESTGFIINVVSICLPRFPSEQRAQGKLFIFSAMSKNLYPKQLISFADQIALLKDRG